MLILPALFRSSNQFLPAPIAFKDHLLPAPFICANLILPAPSRVTNSPLPSLFRHVPFEVGCGGLSACLPSLYAMTVPSGIVSASHFRALIATC